MSDTPRTDEAWSGRDMKGYTINILDFARQLERELAAVTKERDRLRDKKWEGIAKLESDLSASQQEVARLRDALEIIQCDARCVGDEWLSAQQDGIRSIIRNIREKSAAAISSTPAPVRTDTERWFPMQYGPSIPWSFAELLYVGYSACYGDKQTLERLAQRGGFSWSEIEHFWGSKTFREAIGAALAELKGVTL